MPLYSMMARSGKRNTGSATKALLLLFFSLSLAHALETGGRRGAFLSTTGSFTLSGGGNRAGNDESLLDSQRVWTSALDEDLGDSQGDEASNDLDSASELSSDAGDGHIIKELGSKFRAAKKALEAAKKARASKLSTNDAKEHEAGSGISLLREEKLVATIPQPAVMEDLEATPKPAAAAATPKQPTTPAVAPKVAPQPATPPPEENLASPPKENEDPGATARCIGPNAAGIQTGRLYCSNTKATWQLKASQNNETIDCPDGITPMGVFWVNEGKIECHGWNDARMKEAYQSAGPDRHDAGARIITKMSIQQHDKKAATLRMKRLWCKNNTCGVFKVGLCIQLAEDFFTDRRIAETDKKEVQAFGRKAMEILNAAGEANAKAGYGAHNYTLPAQYRCTGTPAKRSEEGLKVF